MATQNSIDPKYTLDEFIDNLGPIDIHGNRIDKEKVYETLKGSLRHNKNKYKIDIDSLGQASVASFLKYAEDNVTRDLRNYGEKSPLDLEYVIANNPHEHDKIKGKFYYPVVAKMAIMVLALGHGETKVHNYGTSQFPNGVAVYGTVLKSD